MEDILNVFRELRGMPELVGTLSYEIEGRFAYDAGYLTSPHAAPISSSLPLSERPFTLLETAVFFEGLVPEGSRVRLYAEILRGDAASYPRLLSQLSDESVGAVFFSKRTEVDLAARRYVELDTGWETKFAQNPETFPEDTSILTRMSLAGAQGKVGLYRDESGWFLPLGTAPSTHIVKVSSRRFPDETLNEALCLEAARDLEFDVESCELIPTEGSAPLLAVRRFDRVTPPGCDSVDGHTVPWRLHQEDLCQASGLVPAFKYEPTDGNYAARIASTIAKRSSRPSADRVEAFSRLCYDFAVGNCDNHLKNRALLWDAAWERCRLAPMYDVLSTVRYPNLYREMGVGMCASRLIDDVTPEDVRRTGESFGVPTTVVCEIAHEIAEDFTGAMLSAGETWRDRGFGEARPMAREMAAEAAGRLRVLARV